MLFNETVIKNKQNHLDSILNNEALLRKVLSIFSGGQEYEYSQVKRPWDPGGGSTLFSLQAGSQRYFLKVKSCNVFVESKLEREESFINIPSLRNEYLLLQQAKDVSPNTPKFFKYVEEEGFSFLFIENLSPFKDVIDDFGTKELLEVYEQIEGTVRKLYEKGIVHTDVHENNIMFRGNIPVLIDFEEARMLPQQVPFEESLDVAGENAWGNVGRMPEGHGFIDEYTCLNRLKQVFVKLISSRLDDLVRECNFDSSCPFLNALDHGKDGRIYQSINLPGCSIEGQRPLSDNRIDFVIRTADKLFQEPFVHLDIGSNLGLFNIEIGRNEKVKKSIGVEAYEKYVDLAKILAFLSNSSNVEFIKAECGKDSLSELLGEEKIDLVTLYSVYHHIKNKKAFIKDLIRLNPSYLMFEMPVQKECYGGKSWEEEISLISQEMEMPYWYLLTESDDYKRPIVLLSRTDHKLWESKEPADWDIYYKMMNWSWGETKEKAPDYFKRLAFSVPKARGRVLEIGCGIGTMTKWLSESKEVEEIVAVDVCPEAIGELKKCNLPKVIPLEMKMQDFQIAPQRTFDTVMIYEVLEHLYLYEEMSFLERLRPYIKPTTRFVVSVPIGWMESPRHIRGFSKKAFERHLKRLYGNPVEIDYSSGYSQVAWGDFNCASAGGRTQNVRSTPRKVSISVKQSGREFDFSPSSPKVSIILPTYNHFKFLPQAVESILSQTYDDFELIIVNDGSTDGTREYLDNLKDPRITVIHQENKHLPEALNTGFRTAHGELLTWISSDNYCAPTFLEAFVSAMDANPNAGLAYSTFARIDEHDQITGEMRCPDLDYRRMLLNFPGMASFMYRRICQEKVGLYDPGLEGSEDWDMWLRIVEQFQTVYVPEILYYYRRHKDSMTEKTPKKVSRASLQTFQNAINRLSLESLYPSLGHCKDQAAAKFHAWFDFGTVLVHSKYGLQTGAACKFLEKALSLRPDSIEVAGNLAVAYALSEQWEKVVPLVRRILKDAQSPKFLGICRPILEAYKTNNPKLLLSAHLFEVDKNNSELFQPRQEPGRGLPHGPKVTSETPSSENIDEKDSDDTPLDYFLKAGREFNHGNYKAAMEYMQRYRTTIDYSQFPRTLITSHKNDNIDISVIVVTYNKADDLKECLKSLSRQDGANCSFEVIVVDNGQSDINSFKQYVDQYINCPINFNLSEGRNIGAYFARGEIIVFLDDDALVGTDYISSIKSAFDKFDIFGLRGRAYPKNSPATNDHVNIYDLGDRPFPSYCNQEGNSAFLLEVYKSMGGMDPLLFGHEGSDLTYRIIKEHKHANKIIYWPETIIYHDYGTEDKCRQKKRIHQQSANYLKYKHDSDIFVNRRDIEKYPLPLKQNQKLLDKDSSAQVGLLSRKTQFNRESAKAPELPDGKSADIISAASVSHRHLKVSIVVSCHNSEKFLPECLDSIRNQTMNEWELFLLDDASTDGTTSIIEKYSRMDERIKAHYFQDNKGPYVRRNFAIERANSDFIVIQDADDIMCPTKLETLYNEITKNERLGLVGSFYQMFLDEFKGLEYTDRIELPIMHDEIMGHYCSARYVCWHGSAIIRKTMFEAIGLYDEHPYGSDKLWLAKMAEYARWSNDVRLKNVPEYLTLKREHPLSQQGLLPTLDPRSRRTRFQVYWEYKLVKIREKLQKEPATDLAAELRSCNCSDYIERFGYMFEQWESEPLDDEHLHGFISKGIREFCIAKYASCIITLNSVQRMVGDVTEKFRNYDLLWGLANFALDRKEQCEFHIKREIKQHYNPKAEQFLNKYLNDSDAAGRLTASERGVIIKRVIFGSDDKKLCVAGEADDTIVRRTYNLREAAQPRLSIVIVASGNRTELLETLSALNNQSDNRFEVIVINSVPDETFEAQHVADKPAYGLSVIELAQKTSTILAKNIGIYRAKGDYVAFLAEDAVPDRGLVGNIISHFENSNVSGLRGRLLSKSGVYKPGYYDLGDRAVCNGCDTDEICAFRRDILVEVGGFTENLYGNESLELSCRIYEARQRDIESVMYFPDVIVYRRAYSSEQEYTGRMFIEERLRYEQIKEMAVQKSPQMLAYLDFSQRLYPSKMREHENHYYWLVNNSLLLQERCPEEAVVWAEKAVSLEPEVVEGRYMLGLVYVSLGKYSEAQQQLEPILAPLIRMLECGQTTAHGSDLKPAVCYVDTCTKLAQCYMKQGKYDKQKQIFTHLLNNPHIKLPEQQRTGFCALLANLEKSRPPAPVSKPALSSPTIGTDQQPLVSVIIPAYNAERYVAETIKSVLNQSYKNFELVVVNDGSIDQTKDIVLSFQDERIKYLYQENRGIASAHNVGIKNSKGNFLIKLDSDDMMTPDFIVRHLVEFRGHPEADLVYCDDYLIDEEGKPIRVIERPEYSDRKSLIRDLFRCGFPVVPFRTCIRRGVFDKIGFFDEDLQMAEDYDMMRRFVKNGLKIHHLKGALYLRRMTSDSLSRNFTAEKAKSHFDVVKRFTETFTYDELFPDVAWDKIAPERRQLHAECLAGVTYLAIGQTYVKSNSPIYAKTAFGHACSELNNCLKMDPGNQRIRQLLQKCEFSRQKYDEQIHQAVR